MIRTDSPHPPKAMQLISTTFLGNFPLLFSYSSLTGNYVWPKGGWMGELDGGGYRSHCLTQRMSSPQRLYGKIYCAAASIKPFNGVDVVRYTDSCCQ